MEEPGVHGVAKSWTRLRDFTFFLSFFTLSFWKSLQIQGVALRIAILLVLRKWLIIFMNLMQPYITATRFLVNFTAGWDLLAQKPTNFQFASLHVKLFSTSLNEQFFDHSVPICTSYECPSFCWCWYDNLVVIGLKQLLPFRALEAETPCCAARTPWLKPSLWAPAPQKFPCPPSSLSGRCPSGYKPLHRLVLRGTSSSLATRLLMLLFSHLVTSNSSAAPWTVAC